MYQEPLTLFQEEEEYSVPPVHLAEPTITRIECFQLDGELSDQLLPGHGTDCQCGLLTITTSHGTCGLGQFEVPCSNLRGDFVQWAVVFQRLKGLTLRDGLDYVHQKEKTWGEVRTQIIEIALTELCDNLAPMSRHEKERGLSLDRTYLFAHSGAYISF
ncbi:hypothetical protein A8709_05075 [Paenibacillus pectinilyticus]|uniref:Uncharacterized protein n=1 Tax=Paenibacillus pectinilyticus TaxID=512399 RepID=A0A1C0ZSK6_9BACL|nr:hypothetical protein [Paenibacillus pectinilyticus]OCT11070.1 hypothetical protein A8709_05075 [Paenibacillus pectinilyticus]